MRAETQARAQRALDLFNLCHPEKDQTPTATRKESSPVPVSPRQTLIRLEKLAREEAPASPEYLSQSALALQDVGSVGFQMGFTEEQNRKQIRQNRWQEEELSDKLEMLGSEGRLSRLLSRRQRRRLEVQQEQGRTQNTGLEEQTKQQRALTNRIFDQARVVREKQAEVLLTQIQQDFLGIDQSYEQLTQKILQDGKIPAAISEAYIEQFVAPLIARAGQEDNLTPEKQQALAAAVRDCVARRDQPEEERQESRSQLHQLARQSDLLEAEEKLGPLLDGQDKKIVQQMMVQLAAQEMDSLEEALVGCSTNRSRWEVYASLDMASSLSGTNDSWRAQRAARRLGNEDFLTRLDMRIWQALKTAPAAREVWGEEIEKLDQECYSTALAKSLTDKEGADIDRLVFYPTPDAIRNLTVLAAADLASYRTVHANCALATLARRPDWPKLLDGAEKDYPALKSARPLLASWQLRNPYSHPDIQRTAAGFNRAVLESSPPDSPLAELAAQALPNRELLDILTKKGGVTGEAATVFSQAADLLQAKVEERGKGIRLDKERNVIPYVSAGSFNSALRGQLLDLLRERPSEPAESQPNRLGRLKILSDKILANPEDYTVLNYLSENNVLKKLQDPNLPEEQIPVFLGAAEKCPALVFSPVNRLREEFCRQFKGEESITALRDLSAAYHGHEKQLLSLYALVGTGQLTTERVIALANRGLDTLPEELMSAAIRTPQFFLASDTGLDLVQQAASRSMFPDNRQTDMELGELVTRLAGTNNYYFSEITRVLFTPEIKRADDRAKQGEALSLTEENWPAQLGLYIHSQADAYAWDKLSPEAATQVKELFASAAARDFCLTHLRREWQTYLAGDEPAEQPFSLLALEQLVHTHGGAGPLSQIESLSLLALEVTGARLKKTTVERTKGEIFTGLGAMETRFERERWSNDERSDFYNVSRDILRAAPSLFTDYLALFDRLTPAQMRQFAREIYPLHRAKLALLEKIDARGTKTYDRAQLLAMRTDIRQTAGSITPDEKSFEKQRAKLLVEIQASFKDRFGIVKIPENFSPETIRSFTNISVYLANMASRAPEKETKLGFYLGLMLNNAWDDFRQNREIDPSAYLVPEKSDEIKKFLETRKTNDPLTPENLGLDPADLPEFQRLLQQETRHLVVGNVETIDVKLGNIILNLETLKDLDLYPEPLDKERMRLLLTWGNKRLGAVAAKMHQQLSNPARALEWSEEDRQIRGEIERASQTNDLKLDPPTIKTAWQEGIRPLATVANLLNFVETTQAQGEIESLRRFLQPSPEVIALFKKLGEDFEPSSGARALSQDLNYLDNLVVKREAELTPEEKAVLTEYTAAIRERLVKLEGTYAQIKEKFGSLRSSGKESRNPQLRDKLAQIEKIINASAAEQVVTSTVTNDLNVIVENIRECLSCTHTGSNNDTDLTFGDSNKFYLYSQTEAQAHGSIADQIVFLEPIKRANGTSEMAFVLDKIWGSNTPIVLENQVEVIVRKQQALKKRFPGLKLSTLVSDAAIVTGGTSSEMFVGRLRAKKIAAVEASVEVNVVASAAGDHYVEFGRNTGRKAGPNPVEGVLIAG